MDAQRKEFALGTSAAVFAMVCWGTVPLFMKYLTVPFKDPWTMNMFRYEVAALLYIPFVIHFTRTGVLTRRLLLKSLFPTIINILGQILWAMAPFHMLPGLMSIFIKTSIIWSTLASLLFFVDERPLVRKIGFWVGVAITVASIAALSVVQLNPEAKAAEITFTGLTIILACAVFWGLYPVSIKMTFKDTDPRAAFGLLCVNTAAVLIVLGLLKGEPGLLLELPAKPIIIMILSALVGIALSHLTYCFALNTIGVIVATNITMLTPIYTLTLSKIFFGEEISAAKVIFGLILIGGVALITLVRQKTAKEGRLAA
jgi:drug/metabolite transporter (DMT)-like permease